MFRAMVVLMVVLMVVFAAAAYGQDEGLSINKEKVMEATGLMQMDPYIMGRMVISNPGDEWESFLIKSASQEAELADLKIQAASDVVVIKEKTKTIESLNQQINGAAGELKRLTFLLQDKETEIANLYQLLKQFSEEIDKSKAAKEKEKLIQSFQQTIFNVLFNNTRKGLSK